MSSLPGKVALVTGASRGVGACVAERLAEQGDDVVINFRSKALRAEAVAERVRAYGRSALPAQADLTNEAEVYAMMSHIQEQFGKLDRLILNASGGLEKDRSADYAQQLNVTAQIRTLELAMPLMPPGSRIVFVTSHPAHFYGDVEELPTYEPVALSKHEGELALRARLPELAQRGLSLIIVSGDLIENSITAKLLRRAQPERIEQRCRTLGSLLTVETFAAAIVTAATDTSLESGATILAGERLG